MPKPVIWFLGALAAVAVLAGVVALVQPGRAPTMSAEEERKFNEEFEVSMRRECISSARAAAAREGRSGAEIDQAVEKRCACAIEVVRPLPVAEKAALHTDSDKLKNLLAEIVRRCGQ